MIQERTLGIGGDTIALWDRPGSALPLVLIHGNSVAKECFRGLFDSPVLAEHRMIAFDLPGCGASSDASDPYGTYTLFGLGGVLEAVLKTLELEHYVLVGWSMGGHLAIQMLLCDATPDGIVLTGTPPCGPDPAEIAATFLPVPGSEIMTLPDTTPEQRAAFVKLVYAPSEPSAALRQATERADGRLRQRLFEYIFANPQLEPQRTTIARWPGPFALIQGRDEPMFDPTKLDDLKWGQLWRGGTQWIEGAGHAPFFTKPDDYARLLKAFVDDISKPA
ncbi:MAG TPA: alpha/beta hydrolase [Rhizomicrobium sp.]|nr:alpha/beta hydrolase [Rhizomicrobium sp.]